MLKWNIVTFSLPWGWMWKHSAFFFSSSSGLVVLISFCIGFVLVFCSWRGLLLKTLAPLSLPPPVAEKLQLIHLVLQQDKTSEPYLEDSLGFACHRQGWSLGCHHHLHPWPESAHDLVLHLLGHSSPIRHLHIHLLPHSSSHHPQAPALPPVVPHCWPGSRLAPRVPPGPLCLMIPLAQGLEIQPLPQFKDCLPLNCSTKYNFLLSHVKF